MMNSTPAKSARRALELLDFFAEWRRPAGVSEICRTLGYPQSSTSMLLKCLSESGYFDHDPRTGMYTPNIRLALATAWISDQLFSEQSLLRLMERLLESCGHTVMIGMRKGHQARYLHVLQATRTERFTAQIGWLRPLFRSAMGKMLVTTLPEREVVPLLRKANALEADESLRLDLDVVLRERQAGLQAGYAMSEGTAVPGAATIAILLPVPPRQEPMTLSIGGPMQEIRRDKAALIALLNNAVADFRKAVQSAASEHHGARAP